MKAYKRQDRVASLIMRELATIILQRNINPLFTGVTVTSVRVSPDLAYAKVYFTVFDESKLNETLEALNKSSVLLQHLLAQKVKLRIAAKLNFIYDESIDYAKKMAVLIDKAITNDKKREN